jgi:hypothetical protein
VCETRACYGTSPHSQIGLAPTWRHTLHVEGPVFCVCESANSTVKVSVRDSSFAPGGMKV